MIWFLLVSSVPSEGEAVEDSEKPDSSVPDATSFNFGAAAVQGSTVSPRCGISVAARPAVASLPHLGQVGFGVVASTPTCMLAFS